MWEETFFMNRKLDVGQLAAYGFMPADDGHTYTAALLEGQLQLTVFITPAGAVSTQVTEEATGEPYTLYKVPTAAGAWVGQVRDAVQAVLEDIAAVCYKPDAFHSPQAQAVIRHVQMEFGDAPQFLWKKFPNNAIWRRQDTGKWYGIIISIAKSKLGASGDGMVEALVLRLPPQDMQSILDHKSYFPGWHMNKKNWYTVLLDGSVPLEVLYQHIQKSYQLAVK